MTWQADQQAIDMQIRSLQGMLLGGSSIGGLANIFDNREVNMDVGGRKYRVKVQRTSGLSTDTAHCAAYMKWFKGVLIGVRLGIPYGPRMPRKERGI
jgi:hypothetical protein